MNGRGMEAEESCSIPLPFIPLPIFVRFAFAAVVLTSPAAFLQIFAAREDFVALQCRGTKELKEFCALDKRGGGFVEVCDGRFEFQLPRLLIEFSFAGFVPQTQAVKNKLRYGRVNFYRTAKEFLQGLLQSA